MEMYFPHDPSNPWPWNAYEAAERTARSLGFAVGPMEAGSPTALKRDVDAVAKWRNLSPAEQNGVDGMIAPAPGYARFRRSGVVLITKEAA